MNLLLADLDLDELMQTYNSSSPDMKEYYEKRYGKERILKLIAESENSKFLRENCKNCPSCRVPIEVCLIIHSN